VKKPSWEQATITAPTSLPSHECEVAIVNFGNPRANIGAAIPGRIDTAGDARIMQFGLRMTF